MSRDVPNPTPSRPAAAPVRECDVVVIGGGAAGLFCAAIAGARGRSVTVLEGSNRVGKKILMSGGGRCNFTNLNVQPENFLSANPHFCKSALGRYTPWHFIELVSKHDIPWHEKDLGQLFCDNSSRDILDMLLAECRRAGVEILTHARTARVEALEPGFGLETTQGTFRCEALVVATGGLSIPNAGATGFGHELAEQFGHAIVPTRPALVPLTWNSRDKPLFSELSGVSVPVRASTRPGPNTVWRSMVSDRSVSFRGDLLITHRGLSGPAILQISSYWDGSGPVELDWLDGLDLATQLREERTAKGRRTAAAHLSEILPKRLARRLLSPPLRPEGELTRPLSQWSKAAIARLGEDLRTFPFQPGGSEGYRTAEVTLGGVATDELSSRTMESRRRPGLYFIGEVVDVTGHLGGYNFQWAWASAHAAGEVC